MALASYACSRRPECNSDGVAGKEPVGRDALSGHAAVNGVPFTGVARDNAQSDHGTTRPAQIVVRRIPLSSLWHDRLR
jgi:hypothetical protein